MTLVTEGLCKAWLGVQLKVQCELGKPLPLWGLGSSICEMATLGVQIQTPGSSQVASEWNGQGIGTIAGGGYCGNLMDLFYLRGAACWWSQNGLWAQVAWLLNRQDSSILNFILPVFFLNIYIYIYIYIYFLFTNPSLWLSIDLSKGAAVLRRKLRPRSRSSMHGLTPGSPPMCVVWQVRGWLPFRLCLMSQGLSLTRGAVECASLYF